MSSKKLRVGFIGTGRISTLHQLNYQQNPDAELVALCDKNKKALRTRAAEWNIPEDHTFTDLDAFLNLKDLDAVEILTPHSTHKDIAVKACETGKHICVQKVPCMSLSQFDAMQDAARKAGVKIKIYENFQFHPPYRKAMDLIKSGGLGRAIAVNIRMWQAQKALSQWQVPLNAWLWRISEKDNFKLPTLWDDGYHKHNIVQLFLAKEIVSVQAWKKGIRLMKVLPIDVPAVISYKTKGTDYGTWNVSMSQSVPIKSDYYGCEEALEVQCEHGIIWVNGCTGNMFVNCGCGGPGGPGVYWLDPKGEWHSDCSMPTNWKYSFLACSKDFVDAIKEDRPPYRSGAEARHILQVDLAMVASLRSGFSDFRVSAITDGIPKHLNEEEFKPPAGIESNLPEEEE